MELTKDIKEKLEKLDKKYASIGQDLPAYLDGLLYANPLHYWDYTYVDTLLSLQHPKTDFPDEQIFIIYHQITELYFKLALLELEQISNNGKKMSDDGRDMGWNDSLSPDFFVERLKRINSYFEVLTSSFGIMVNGMEKEQFLKFRMSLLPSSGFQSAQYRLIEISCSHLINLTDKEQREKLKDASIEEMAQHFYWKDGAIDVKTGKKTLMLENFEKKYMAQFIQRAHQFRDKNLMAKYQQLSVEEQQNEDLIHQLRLLDLNVNVNWPLVHYKSAVRYLASGKEDIDATGGTNWQKYLPPRFQKRIFFPELWTEEEMNNWGRQWVVKALSES
ncbi:tryptophan 2,3-dioxygenase family protein [Flavobacteriales bacterium]|jgi:tryptophan 2,3-dioxygenase|nr:tryptophan 2,3-dioxygenase family protein [Flavobacteriales bacterium]MDB2361852.1 tryptophan 2,3-dioxygenase family protein [Flavobacteriales bacterium]